MAIVQHAVIKTAAALIEQDMMDKTLMALLDHGFDLNKHK